MARGIEHRLRDMFALRRQAVVDPQPALLGLDQARSSQIPQMAGRLRLRNPQRLVYVADADFSTKQ